MAGKSKGSGRKGRGGGGGGEERAFVFVLGGPVTKDEAIGRFLELRSKLARQPRGRRDPELVRSVAMMAVGINRGFGRQIIRPDLYVDFGA